MQNPKLTITFLGTGTSSGVPMIACPCEVCHSSDQKDKRFRSSILVKSKTTTIVVDTTPDFRSQMLKENVRELDAVLITHHHKDHIAGLDDVKAFCYFQEESMPVYSTTISQDAIKKEFSYAFAEKKYPGVPEIELKTIDDEMFMVGDIPVIPIKVWHHKMPVTGFRFGGFTYITDANRIDDSEKEKIKGSEILVLNALRHKKHISHFTLEEAIQLSQELKVNQCYFTHISHQLGLHEEVEKSLPANCHLAYDGLSLKIPIINRP